MDRVKGHVDCDDWLWWTDLRSESLTLFPVYLQDSPVLSMESEEQKMIQELLHLHSNTTPMTILLW
jgi:hypothetical protein